MSLHANTDDAQSIPIGAFTVNELQLSPALCVDPQDSVGKALQEAWLRDFSILPVTSRRQLLGYLDVVDTSAQLKKDPSISEKALKDTMKRFQRQKPYHVITPDTGLDELSDFFQSNEFAIVTDESRRFVLGVCCRSDLDTFASRFAPRRTPSPTHTITGR